VTDDTRDALSALSASESWYRTTVDRAVAATDDIEAAAAFAEAGGVERLRRAVATAERRDDDRTARAGRRALAAFERLRRAARGRESSDEERPGFRLHPARGTHLTRDGQRTDR